MRRHGTSGPRSARGGGFGRWSTLRALVGMGALAGLVGAGARPAPLTDAPPRQEAGAADEHSHADGHEHGEDHAQAGTDDHGHAHEDEHADEVFIRPEQVERWGVRTERAALRVLHRTVSAPGRVVFKPEALAHVGAPVEGRVAEVLSNVGERVARGEPLMVIESTALAESQADLYMSTIAAQTAAPAVELARVSWQRALELHERSQGIALTEVSQREAEYRAAAGALRLAESGALGARHRLRALGMSEAEIDAVARTGEVSARYTVRSPIDGEVVERGPTLGELVGPGGGSLAVIADASRIWVIADVAEAWVTRVAPGTTAWVRPLGVADTVLEGAVTFVSPIIEQGTRTADARVEVAHGLDLLRPGMYVSVALETDEPWSEGATRVLAVPLEAVQSVENRTVVFTPAPGEPGVYRATPVRLGEPAGAYAPVLGGLREGDEYVAHGAFILKAELGKASAEHQH